MPLDLIPPYIAHLAALGRTEATITKRAEILGRMHASLPLGLDVANADELRLWIYRPEWSVQTRATYLTAARSFFRWAVSTAAGPALDYDPSAELPIPKVPERRPKPVSDEQLAAVLAIVVEPVKTWVILAAYAGARCIEISRLDREHVTEQVTRLHGKGGKERYVSTYPIVWELLRDRPPGPIARDTDGSRLTARQISPRARCWLEHRGYPIGLHRFRHWYGTQTANQARDLRVAQELLGHKDLSTTQGYAFFSSPEVVDAVRALPWLGSPAVSDPPDEDDAGS